MSRKAGQRAKTCVLLGRDRRSRLGRRRGPALAEKSVFSLFQMTKTSLSCIPELLGMCLLLNPRARVLGRRLGQEQKHDANTRGQSPRSVCPAAGVQEETQMPQACGGRKVPAQLPRGGGPAREAPGRGRQLSVRVQQRLKGQGSPRTVCASLWHSSFRRVWLLPFLLTLQSHLGKLEKQKDSLVPEDLAKAFRCQAFIKNIVYAGCQVCSPRSYILIGRH